MDRYDATVVVPTYNRLNDLRETLKSLAAQITNFSFEVIVCDDGSSAKSISVVEEFVKNPKPDKEESHVSKNKRRAYYGSRQGSVWNRKRRKEEIESQKQKLNIRYCYQEDLGFRPGAARNMGIRLSEGRIVIFIDAGVILHSKCIDRHIKMHTHEETKPRLIYGYTYGFDTEFQREKEITDICKNHTVDQAIAIMDSKRIYDIREFVYEKLGYDLSLWPAPWIFCWTNNISAPRTVLQEIGGFDESFNTWGGEDIDLGITLFRLGCKILLCKPASGIHLPHGKAHAWRTKPQSEIEAFKEKKKYLAKKHPIPSVKLWLSISNPVILNTVLLGNTEADIEIKYGWSGTNDI